MSGFSCNTACLQTGQFISIDRMPGTGLDAKMQNPRGYGGFLF